MSLRKYEYLFNNQNRSHYLCLDIGGTKIASGIFQASKHLSLDNLIVWQKSESKKGKENLLEAIKKNLEQLFIQIEKRHLFLAPTISIGTPGKLTGKYKTILAPGSAENLGTTPGEFNFLNIQEYLGQILPHHLKYFIHNDGLTQCAGGVQELLEKNIPITNQTIGYIGPGTGLGGGFCTYNKEKGLTFFSDGHIFDILLTDHKKNKNVVMAEDVLSGRGFYDQFKVSTKEVSESPYLLKKYHDEIKIMGYYFGQLCSLIYQGQFIKKNEKNNWSKQNLDRVKGLSQILLGGSLCTKSVFGKQLVKAAQIYLRSCGINQLSLHIITEVEKRALLGAFSFINTKKK